ncbi:ubiquitin carboxyl-terminal hydrolase CYLD-like [Clavelina lepadiformis]|uniref:ubiquitin carboxyl-terminal hydrolase CYLD-like n=1 Tax=Clavelina lepadiformis TaxID=159417 RepID=UPI004041333C
MARRQDLEYTRNLILIRDLCLSRPVYDPRSRKYDAFAGISDCLKGTIMQEVLTASYQSNRLVCSELDSGELIECDESDVEVISEETMELLIAISNCRERFEIYKNKDRLVDGLEMQEGCDVLVKLPANAGEAIGKLRYKGGLHNKLGTYFGIELINAKGKGNTNGAINKARYFSCADDCGIFLPLNKVMSREYNQQRTPIPAPRRSTYKAQRPPPKPPIMSSSNQSSLRSSGSSNSVSSRPIECEPVVGVTDEELGQLEIHIGMKVCIFTEVNGSESQECGTVKFIGRLPNELPTSEIYVGIDLVNPVGNGRGVFNKRHLFKTKANHAALVPLSGVLPASTFDITPALVANGMQTSAAAQPESDRSLRQELINGASHSAGLAQSSQYKGFRNQRQNNMGREEAYGINGNDYLEPIRPAMNARAFERPQPVGGAITDIDDELSSQVDIYGGVSSRYLSSDQDRRPSHQPLYPPGMAPRQNGLKIQTPQFTGHQVENMSSLEIGSMVQVMEELKVLGEYEYIGPVYGVIKWIGYIREMGNDLIAGVELESPIAGFSNGVLNGQNYFDCIPDRGVFVKMKNCQKDPRFLAATEVSRAPMPVAKLPLHNFGDYNATSLPGRIPPPSKLTNDMIGKEKGIQGHHNSCYLDSTLFSMFAYSYCLDTILFRKKNSFDLEQYQHVQQVLKEDIVNPLRKRNFVRADRIMLLRELLDELGSVTGLTNEEKDPEEFLQTLLNHVFKAEPLFELRQGDSDHIQECYFYQIFLDKDEKMVLPSTQLLIEQSFLASDLKFRDVPTCLILQMPRFGKDYKMYNRVRPSLTLDVTDMVEKLPRSCTVCGGLAEYECKQCSIERSMQEHISSYCDQCAKICHQHPMRRQHGYKKIEVCDEYRSYVAQEGEMPVERNILELYAVVCIQTSHYVSFAKCGYGRDAKWCFFDSMADRVGEQTGYNIPEVTYCEKFEEWLLMDQSKLLEMDQREMPDHMRRLLCDAYMCLYQSREMMRFS